MREVHLPGINTLLYKIKLIFGEEFYFSLHKKNRWTFLRDHNFFDEVNIPQIFCLVKFYPIVNLVFY